MAGGQTSWRGAILACLLLTTGMAHAQPMPQSRPQAGAVAAFDEQQRAYGAWFARLFAAYQPAIDVAKELAQLLSSTGPMDQTWRTRLDALMDRYRGLAGSIELQLAGFDTPDFPALGLPAELRTAALLREARRLIHDVGVFSESLHQLSEAVRRNDPRARARAQQATLENARGLISSQILSERASLAITPRSTSNWDASSLRIEYFQTGLDLMQASLQRENPQLATVFSERADRVARFTRDGSAKLETEIGFAAALQARAEAARRPTEAAMARRFAEALRGYREGFAFYADFETLLRDVAVLLRGPSEAAHLIRLAGQYTAIGVRIDGVYQALIEALARR